MRYKILIEDRKDIVNAMEAATGEKPEYIRMPRCAYILQGIAVEKTGYVTTEEDADLELLGHLIGAGLIKRVRESAAQEVPTQEMDTAEAEASAETSAVEETEEGTKAETEEETEETVTEGTDPEAAGNEPPAGEEPAEETTGESESEEDAVGEETEEDSEVAPEADVPYREEEVVAAAACYASLAPSDPQTVRPTISFPLERHDANSICNLVFTVASRGSLISKATQGSFSVSEKLVEELKSGRLFTREDALDIIRNAGDGALKGISFEEDKVVFDGFPESGNPDEIKAWTVFAATVSKACIKQKHVHPKLVDETNEKFAFRTWLTRLGMNGTDTKAERNILYRHLTGHTAFRTPADEEKWKARQAAKRAELKAAKEAEAAENGAEERP